MKNKLKIFSILILLFCCVWFFYQYNRTDPIISLGVSTDGRYVISAHASRNAHPFFPKGQLVLWDIEKKEKKVLANKVNAYSAAFIPNSHEFMWQDDKDVVHIQNVEGKELASFKHFVLTGHLMSANKDFYLSANEHGQLFKGYGEQIIPIYTDGGIGTPLTLSMTEKYILSAGVTGSTGKSVVVETNLTKNPINPDSSKSFSYDGVTLWDRHTLKPVARLWGNNGKTTGLISPDGKWVVTGEENSPGYMWQLDNPMNRLGLARVKRGIYDSKSDSYDKSELLSIPDKFEDKIIYSGGGGTVAIVFLTEKEFIPLGRIYNTPNPNGYDDTFNVVPLYTAGSPWIKGYVEIEQEPKISTNYYGRNLSVSSSPKAHILVTGQATGGGINVYKYHPDKMELEKIWVAD
ncbi:hypothetical protein EDC44_13719 [Cricetibacter osteomyelitidis]|uniref:WD40 repeat protein n=1 Tax=Cricetibacter osteomyelitidis TaxID=1521931 RepID=A0A4V6NS38_9PAST|nr:WD40 repeat domain-containing protein [Cricetibacter osteomyelitidis]TCP91183.1 hypothetical protein EDC44_13719 [Cricetibacter osteomyelitidis]